MIELIIGLSALLIFQQVFFFWQTHKLINKLMSRNFSEYKTTESYKPAKKKEVAPLKADSDLEEQAELANKMFGI